MKIQDETEIMTTIVCNQRSYDVPQDVAKELAASQAQVARLRAAVALLLSSFVRKESYPEWNDSGNNDRFIDLATVETSARELLKETNPNATVPVASRGRWDAKD